MTSTSDLTLPPGPAAFLLLRFVGRIRRDPLGFFEDMIREHGDLVFLGTQHTQPVGYQRFFLAAHPDMARHVLVTNHQNYRKDYTILSSFLGQGLLTSEGEQWKRQRAVIQPLFHKARADTFGAHALTAAQALLARWSRPAAAGESIELVEEMARVTLDVLLMSIVGETASDEHRVFHEALPVALSEIVHRMWAVFSPPLYVPTKRNRRFKRAKAALDAVVTGLIHRRREAIGRRSSAEATSTAASEPGSDARPEPREEPEDSADLISELLAAYGEEATEAGDRRVRDELMTMLVAGHETLANAMTWTLYLLSQHPAAVERLEAEIDRVAAGRALQVSDLPNLRYCSAVFSESMRLFPPAWSMFRTAIEDDVVGGHRVPAGTMVMVAIHAIHKHPGFWRDPDRFDPERFMQGEEPGGHRFAYFPFGRGPRMCIGKAMAETEATLVLAAICQRYRFELCPGQAIERLPLVVLRPKHGIRVRLRQR